ncbi:phosphatidylcholine:ceramide cholinephosphotransferase 1-like protein [Sarcoptes scabiei]|uniref:Phosphatidylcholine:ceramide cholinephosphotransferase 1-like protein n=1 Tax=Sarcoptes scabiei TaxID=52283 RepID=A0A132A4J5_SARSC|nr:phosphatidylcholine:ceramide cholinephosphotransferase 1-like protein [Sarcoptes scabiei]
MKNDQHNFYNNHHHSNLNPHLHSQPQNFSIDLENSVNLDDSQSSTSHHLSLCANRLSLFSSLIFLFLAVFINLGVLAIIHERVPYQQPPLPDMSFEILPHHDYALNICEYIIIFMSVSVMIMIFSHRFCWIIMPRLFIILGFLYLLRAICMASTQVPVSNPKYYCSPKINITEMNMFTLTKTILYRIIFMSVGMGLSVNGHHTYCGDYIFSGHTVILVTGDLFLMYYWLDGRKKLCFYIIRYLYHFLVATGIVAILIARGHYLVDVILGLILSKLFFVCYHSMCIHSMNLNQFQSDKLQDQFSSNHHPYNNQFHHSNRYARGTSTLIKTFNPNFHHNTHLNSWSLRIVQAFERNSIENQIIIKNDFRWPWTIFSKRSNLLMSI